MTNADKYNKRNEFLRDSKNFGFTFMPKYEYVDVFKNQQHYVLFYDGKRATSEQQHNTGKFFEHMEKLGNYDDLFKA